MNNDKQKKIFIKKFYDRDEKIFYVFEYSYDGKYKTDLKKELYYDLKSFAKGIKYDFKGADLYYYEFKDNELDKYDLSECIISSKYQKKLSIYNSSFCNTIKKELSINKYERVKTEIVTNEHKPDIANDAFSENLHNIMYISDLHLNLKSEFSEDFNIYDFLHYIEEYALKFVKSALELKTDYSSQYNNYFILGDISNSILINYYFLKYIYNSKIFDDSKPNADNIFIVLGNHEIWNQDNICDENENNKLLKIQNEYKKLANLLGFIVLDNSLYLRYNSGEIENINYCELKNISPNDLRNKCLQASLIVYGGTGFSGYNNEFNADNGIYMMTLSREEEIKETEKFENLYNKLIEACKDLKVIVASHMPVHCWHKGEHNPGWIYLNGHTHKNDFINYNNIKDYHDNQVGYTQKSLNLKLINLNLDNDIFKDYSDGIHKITRNQYVYFYRGKCNKPMTFNYEYNNLYMLKKFGYYLFLMEGLNGKLYWLEGGHIRKTNNNDINYYYNHMDYMIQFFNNNKFIKVNENIKDISKFVKKIGGSGRIHGCIVDIDFCSHIYYNFTDGKITYYWANMSNEVQHIYKNLKSLIYNCCDKRISEKLENLNITDGNLLMKYNDNNLKIINEYETIETQQIIYKQSKMMMTSQYAYYNRIIRFWDDKLVNKKLIELNEEQIETIFNNNEINNENYKLEF